MLLRALKGQLAELIQFEVCNKEHAKLPSREGSKLIS